MKKFLLSFSIAFSLLAAFVAAAECTDTDGGVHFKVKGSVTGLDIEKNKLATYEDECFSPTQIREYYCHFKEDRYPEGYVVSWVAYCPKCENGACPAWDGEDYDVFATATCTDSDGGLDYRTKGVVTEMSKDQSQKKVYEDKCAQLPEDVGGPEVRGSTEVLEERYCKDGSAKIVLAKCDPDICQGGACMPTSAMSAYITNLEGDVTSLKKSISSQKNLEGELDAVKGDLEELKKKCQAAAGQPITGPVTVTPTTVGSCTDSDGGLTIGVKGTTKGPVLATGKTMSFSDECVGGNKVREHFCASGKKYKGYVSYNVETCPSGCSDGKCATTPTGSFIKVQGKENLWARFKNWIENLKKEP